METEFVRQPTPTNTFISIKPPIPAELVEEARDIIGDHARDESDTMLGWFVVGNFIEDAPAEVNRIVRELEGLF